MENIKHSSGDYCSLGNQVPNIYETLDVTEEDGKSETAKEHASSQRKNTKLKKFVCIGVTTVVILSCAITLAILVYILSSNKGGKSPKDGHCPKYTNIGNSKVINTTGSNHRDIIDIKCESPTCKAVDCGVPKHIANAEIIGLYNTTYNSTFSVECGKGYKITGPKTVKCSNSGLWGELPTCEIISCGLPHIPTHGSLSKITGTSFQATATIKCDEGFYLKGNNVISCQVNGHWTTGARCMKIDCLTGWDFFDGSCYLFSVEFRGWEAAKAFCESQNASLVKVADAKENDYIRSVIAVKNSKNFYWIGGRYYTNVDEYRWIDGTAITFNGWGPNEPSGAIGCMDYLNYGEVVWQWNDHHDCVNTKGPHICEIDLIIQ